MVNRGVQTPVKVGQPPEGLLRNAATEAFPQVCALPKVVLCYLSCQTYPKVCAPVHVCTIPPTDDLEEAARWRRKSGGEKGREK